MAKNTRQQFVQAKLKATGKDATPEQRAKLRERFNTLSETKEGRTKIAQTILPSGAASDRAALKKSIKPTTTGVTGGVSTPPSSSASSAVVPGAKLTPARDAVPFTPTRLSTKRVDPGYTPSYPSTYVPSDAARFLQNKNVPGLRLIPKIGQEIDKGNYLGSAGKVVQAAAEVRLATKFLQNFGAQFSKNLIGVAAKGTRSTTSALTKTMGKTPGRLSQKPPTLVASKLATRGTGAKVAQRMGPAKNASKNTTRKR